jgi:hypothetical protein
MGNRPPLRSSILVVVLVTLVFATAALTALVEKAGNDLLVEVRQADARRLRQEAFSALEVTVAVLEDFRQADNGLHSPSEGWSDPLAWANWSPGEGRKVEVTFRDESGKIPAAHADLTTLTSLFEAWQMQQSDAEKLADSIEGWMQGGYVYSTTVAPDYGSATIPYAEPQRPIRSYSELAAISYAKDVFFDENGLPNGYFWRFVDDVSIFKYPQPNVNGANADVLAAVGQYADPQRQQMGDYLAGTGQYAQLGSQWFQNPTTVAAVAGVGGNANAFATTIAALRVNVTVREGKSSFRLSAVLAPQGGATLNQTAATNAAAAASNSSPASTTSVTNAAQPAATATSAQTSAAASQSINYPYTVLEMLEEDDIPQPPPPVTPKS